MTGNYLLYILAQRLLRLLPIRWAYALGCFLAEMQWQLSTRDRQAVIGNLTVALGRVPTQEESKDVFRNFAKYLVDFLTMTKRVTPSFIKNQVEVVGIQAIHTVLAMKKGAVIVSSHLGNWEMGGAFFSFLGYPVSVVALAHQDEKVNLFFNQQREAVGCSVIQTNVAVRRVIEHLHMNKLVAILAERDFGQHGMKMNFLGKETMIPKGAAMFSLKTGAPIVPVFFIRCPDDKFKVMVHDPILPAQVYNGKIEDEVLKSYIQQYLGIIEQYTRQYPTQWLLFRDFTSV